MYLNVSQKKKKKKRTTTTTKHHESSVELEENKEKSVQKMKLK